jgi:cyclophilin family peptidyl-prolyl cis-trans isomerase
MRRFFLCVAATPWLDGKHVVRSLPYPVLPYGRSSQPVQPSARRCAPPHRAAAPERARRRAAPGAPQRRGRAAQVFGQVVSGYGVVRAAEACGSRGGETAHDVVIADAGVLPPAAAAAGRPGASPARLGVTGGLDAACARAWPGAACNPASHAPCQGAKACAALPARLRLVIIAACVSMQAALSLLPQAMYSCC